jgi:hypothetical protein
LELKPPKTNPRLSPLLLFALRIADTRFTASPNRFVSPFCDNDYPSR